MAKHNCFCSLLTVDVSQSKEERRAGDLLGWAGTCWGRWGQGGGGRWQARSQTVVVLRKDLTPTPPPESKAGAFHAVWDRDVWFSKVIMQIYFLPFSVFLLAPLREVE